MRYDVQTRMTRLVKSTVNYGCRLYFGLSLGNAIKVVKNPELDMYFEPIPLKKIITMKFISSLLIAQEKNYKIIKGKN